MQVREKVAKSQNVVFSNDCGSGGSNSGLGKPRGAGPSGQLRDEKAHAVDVPSTPCSDYFGRLRCRKSAHHCGAKHIAKSKC